MATIFGAIGLNDTDRVFAATKGQTVVLDLINQYFERINTDMNKAMSVFIGRSTEDYKWRYKLPGGGRLQKRGLQSPTGAVKTNGGYDVALPLEDWGATLAETDVSLAYMTAGDMQRHLTSIKNADINTVRFEILKRIFNNVEVSFADPLWGTLLVEPLANGDAALYAPVLGSESEATENCYLESNYAASAISDTNNPLVTVVAKLESHFGIVTGGENICTFIHTDQVAKISALSLFSDVVDSSIRAGDNISVPINLPNVPGRIIGRGYGSWIVEWPWMPTGWSWSTHLEAEPPLDMRIDPADTGLGSGLQLVSNEYDNPNVMAAYRHRFGVGGTNRLNGIVMEYGSGGTYTIPTIYQ